MSIESMRQAALVVSDAGPLGADLFRDLGQAARECRYFEERTRKAELERDDLHEQVKRLHAWREESLEIIAARNATIERVRKLLPRWRRAKIPADEGVVARTCADDLEDALRDVDPADTVSDGVATTGLGQVYDQAAYGAAANYGGGIGRQLAGADQQLVGMQAELKAR